MKIVIIHDYLREYGGAERVVEALHEIWPEAPLYTAFVDWEAMGEFGENFRDWDIRTSWVNRNFIVKKYHSPLRFLTPLVWESLDLRGFDVVISSSGWYISRGVVTRPEQLHISYIHHPPRNLYGYPTGAKQSGLVQAYATLINPFLRMYDFATAQRVDYLIANSEETRSRIKKFYRREAEVIYPPVEIGNNASKPLLTSPLSKGRKGGVTTEKEGGVMKRSYFLSVGRLTYAKRVDLAIHACNQLKLPLKIVGTGREEKSLKAIAGPTIEFVGSVSDRELAKLYAGAKAIIFCALQEDFGMVPVEAMAHGLPVIALRQGGVMETVIDEKTGVFFNEPTVESLTLALKKFQLLIHSNDTYQYSELWRACINQAKKFSKEVFKKRIGEFVKSRWSEHQ